MGREMERGKLGDEVAYGKYISTRKRDKRKQIETKRKREDRRDDERWNGEGS